MKSEENVALAMVVIAFIMGISFGSALQKKYIRDQALKYDVAHYVCDPKTGNVKFEWKK